MTALRTIYDRYLRGTPVANVARGVYRAMPATFRLGTPSLVVRRHSLALALFLHRARYVTSYVGGRGKLGFVWLLGSRESSNFTYDLTPRNEAQLAEMLAIITGRPSTELARYIDELHEDRQLESTIAARVAALGSHSGIDEAARFGRRAGWYALARATKPRVIVETGVEKGLGAAVLCAALLRNSQEGHPGRYFGTDIDQGAGALWVAPYNSAGTILYGDSIESLTKLDATIDLFINDSDHSGDYEAREYQVVEPRLSDRAVVIGDNAHVTDSLLHFAQATGRRFLFFREEPAEHWYPGAGIGFAFR